MKTVDEWKAALRARLKTAMTAREREIVSLLRESLAAIDNAEAPSLAHAPPIAEGTIAGTAGPLGAGEVPRLVLSSDDVRALLARELVERREAIVEYTRLGQHEEARVLARQITVLDALVEEGRPDAAPHDEG